MPNAQLLLADRVLALPGVAFLAGVFFVGVFLGAGAAGAGACMCWGTSVNNKHPVRQQTNLAD